MCHTHFWRYFRTRTRAHARTFGSDSIITLLMSVRERTRLRRQIVSLIMEKGVIVAQRCLMRTLIAIVISRLAVSQPIGKGSSSISSVEHAGQYGHIARNCSQKRRQGAESPGRQDPGTTAKPKDSLQVHSVADYSDKELEQELTRRKLDKEQQLADEPTKSVNVVTGAARCVSRGISCVCPC